MYYAASTTRAGSTTKKNGSPGGSEGVCKGIRSKLEVIETNHNRMTRVEALERFSTVITDFDGSPYDDQDGEFHQHAESTFVSPVLIFQNTNNNNSGDKKQQLLPKEELLPQEQTTPTSETWSCYGATEVEYLVLQDPKTGTKTITAVAPKNTGFSVRGIRSSDSQRTISRLGLGFLDVIHDMSSNVSGDGTESDSIPTPEEVAPRPSVDSLELAKESLLSAIYFSGKVAQHMEMNLAWLGNNLMDDFPSRTLHAGRQILHNLPGTCQSTMNCMRQLVGHLFNDENEDDDRRR